MLQTILIVLKFISIIFGSLIGIYGILHDFKDKDGNITKNGRNILTTMIVAMVISIVSQSVEYIIDQKSTLAEIKINNEILNDINRSLNPVRELRLSCNILLSKDSTNISNFDKRFKKELSLLKKNLRNIPSDVLLNEYKIVIPFREEFGEDEIFIKPESKLLPNELKEKLEYNAFYYNEIYIIVNKKPISIDSIRSKPFEIDRDLSLNFFAGNNPFENIVEDQKNNFFFKVIKNNIHLLCDNIAVDARDYYNNGKILSIQDLAGAQMIISIDNYKNNVDEIVKGFILSELILKVSEGREININKEDLSKIETFDNKPIYIYNFPESF